MSKHLDTPSLPFGTSPSDWAAMTPEMRTQLMQMEMAEAQARHAAHRAETASADQQTWGAALSTVRLLMGLNAGAIVAILAFLGSMIDNSKGLWLPPLVVSLVSFLFGATLSVAACAIAYFAGSTLVTALQGDTLITRYPHVVGTDDSNNAIDASGPASLPGSAFLLGSVAFLNFPIVALAR